MPRLRAINDPKVKALKLKAVEYYRTTPFIRYAAKAIGMSEDRVHEWKAEDPEFAAQLDQAKADAVSKRLRTVNSEWALERIDYETFGAKAKENQTTIIMLPILGGQTVYADNSNKEVGQVTQTPTLHSGGDIGEQDDLDTLTADQPSAE